MVGSVHGARLSPHFEAKSLIFNQEDKNGAKQERFLGKWHISHPKAGPIRDIASSHTVFTEISYRKTRRSNTGHNDQETALSTFQESLSPPRLSHPLCTVT